MHTITGGCHCGNITYKAEFPNEPSTYIPRKCDCKLCTSHGASYASDNDGYLSITIKAESNVSKYRQGSKIADFIICKNCGIMTGLLYEENGTTYGSINIRSSNKFSAFGKGQEMHLTQLNDAKRTSLWKKHWFSNVNVIYKSA